jgi:RHS repeat-associated protein
MEYDWEGRFVRHETGGVETRFTYDHLGSRVTKRSERETTVVVGRLAEARGGSTSYNVYLGNRLACRVHGKKGDFYLEDHLGGIAAVAGESGSIIARREYRAYGEELLKEGETPMGYVGKERDPESGLLYFGARYYDSAVGRWTSKDPHFLTRPDKTGLNSNLYAYAAGNPIRYSDEDGRKVVIDEMGLEAIRPMWVLASGLSNEEQSWLNRSEGGAGMDLEFHPPEGVKLSKRAEVLRALIASTRTYVLRILQDASSDQFEAQMDDGESEWLTANKLTFLLGELVGGIFLPERPRAEDILGILNTAGCYSPDEKSYLLVVVRPDYLGHLAETAYHEMGHAKLFDEGEPFWHPVEEVEDLLDTLRVDP